MKLNFWQILGIILLIAGLCWWIYNKNHATPTTTGPVPSTPAATQPR